MSAETELTTVPICPAEIALKASTIASNAVLTAAGRLDRSTVLASLRVQALAVRHAISAVEVLKRTLLVRGWDQDAIDAAIDVETDPVMAELVRVADADLAGVDVTYTTVNLELET